MTVAFPVSPPDVSRSIRLLGIAGGIGLLISLIGLFQDGTQFWRAWLLGLLCVWTIPIAGIILIMVHHLVGGTWGFVLRPGFVAAARTLPVVALLFLPIPFVMESLYPWAAPDAMAHDALLAKKAMYLNVPGFVTRAIVCFAVWAVLGLIVTNFRLAERRPGFMRGVSGVGLVVMTLTGTVAAIDWHMSVNPHWFSTIYGLLLLMPGVLTCFAIQVGLVSCWPEKFPLADQERRDLGNLTLAFVLVWAYFALSQFLIIYSGNLPEENIWYLQRQDSLALRAEVIALTLFRFALPFGLLLNFRFKQSPVALRRVALLLAVTHLVEMHWLLMPSWGHGDESYHWHWLHAVLPVSLSLIWGSLFLWRWQCRCRKAAEVNG